MSIWELINVSNKVADLGEGPPYFELKKEEITEERKAGRASKTTPHPPTHPFALGLDPPLAT